MEGWQGEGHLFAHDYLRARIAVFRKNAEEDKKVRPSNVAHWTNRIEIVAGLISMSNNVLLSRGQREAIEHSIEGMAQMPPFDRRLERLMVATFINSCSRND